jgi:hypothetical protein
VRSNGETCLKPVIQKIKNKKEERSLENRNNVNWTEGTVDNGDGLLTLLFNFWMLILR